MDGWMDDKCSHGHHLLSAICYGVVTVQSIACPGGGRGLHVMKIPTWLSIQI